MPSARAIASPSGQLARWVLAGPLERDALAARIHTAVGRKWKGIDAFLDRLLERFPAGTRPPLAPVIVHIRQDKPARTLIRKSPPAEPPSPVMAPAAGAPESWVLPPVTTLGDLAAFFGVEPDKIDWLTARGPEHYRYKWVPKRSSGNRLLENPKPLLKSLQRSLHLRMLSRVPPHPAVHSFRRGHSIKTFAAPHAGKPVVLRMDLLDFFPSVGRARVTALFRTAGYPETVASTLGALTTSIAPAEIAAAAPDHSTRSRLVAPHLPQGAPSSPALSNLALFRLDCRLAALAESRDARYTRYADDLAFSGDRDFRRSLERFFIPLVGSIVLEEGFAVNMRKNRVMGQSRRQKLAGVVVNQHPSSARTNRDQLRAILHNCDTHGPASQNRNQHPEFAAHLRGRIAAVAMLDEKQGMRLLELYQRIDWNGS